MNIAPLMAAPVIVQIHVMATLISVVLAVLQLGGVIIGTGPKLGKAADKIEHTQKTISSALRHRILGWAFVVTMTTAALTSFWIVGLRHGQFSWIHALSVLTLVSLPIAIIARRKGNIRRHKWAMIGVSTGLIVAGIFTLLPGRIMRHVIFGL